MASQVIGVEPYIADYDLGLVRVHCTIGLGEPIVLQHVEQGCLACIVEAKEDDVGTLLEEAGPLENTFKEIDYEHFFLITTLYYYL